MPGGFVLASGYGLKRPTGDLNCIAVVPCEQVGVILSVAGRDSPLARKHGLCVQYVTVAEIPENYEERLRQILAGRFAKLRLWGLEVHDLVLTKLTRNHPIDDSDVRDLAKLGVLDPTVLLERYQKELRPCLPAPERHDTTLELWLEYLKDQPPGVGSAVR